MNKYKYIAILFLGLVGCAFNFKTDYRNLPASYRVESCQDLKEKSYDVFYSDENQQCLKGFNINNIEQDVGHIINNNITEDLKYKAVEEYLAIVRCKGSKKFTFETIRSIPTIYEYYERAYVYCKDTGLFDSEKVENLINHYRFYNNISYKKEKYQTLSTYEEAIKMRIKKEIEKKEEEELKKKEEEELKKKEEEKAKALAELEKDPLIQKVKVVAPDFMKTRISGITGGGFPSKCPFIKFIKSIQKYMSVADSNLLFEKDYSFHKKDADTLVMKVKGKHYGTFVKRNESIIITNFLNNNAIAMNHELALLYCDIKGHENVFY